MPLPPDEGEAAPEVVADVAEQMRELHDDIGRWTGRKSDLRKAIELSNRASAAWGHVMAERLAGRLEMNGRRTFATVFLGQLLWGTEEGAKDFERLLTERGRRDLMAPASQGGRKLKRLLWLHTVPHHDAELFQLIEDQGAVVIFEEMGQMHLETVDPDDPFPGLAKRLTDNVMWGTSARRARLNVALAKQLQVDGAVHFNHWGCRHGLGSVPVVRAAFMEAGHPLPGRRRRRPRPRRSAAGEIPPGDGELPGIAVSAPRRSGRPSAREAQRRLPRRLRREQRTIEVMVRLYCRAHHGHAAAAARSSRRRPAAHPSLCPSCAALLHYSNRRIEKCRFGARKPVCASCTVHCFRPEMRDEIRTVMRYSGPRMMFRHPYLAVRHLLDR